jgi:hypothetical protein
VKFVQTMSFRSFHGEQVKKLLDEWQAGQAGKAPGFERARLLQDWERDDTYLMAVTFSSFEEAMKNNDRPETNEWSEKLHQMVEGEIGYRNYDLVWGD